MTRWQAVKKIFRDWAYVSSGAAQNDAIYSLIFLHERSSLEDQIRIFKRHGMHEDAAKAEMKLRELLHPEGTAL